jgi:TM2 domain-containing membrane protein YozV
MKKSSTAYILFCLSFIGLAGFNRFYVGKIGTGVIWLFTLGLFGIGLLYDLFTIPSQVRYANVMKNGLVPQQNVTVNVINATEDQKNIAN